MIIREFVWFTKSSKITSFKCLIAAKLGKEIYSKENLRSTVGVIHKRSL